MKSPNILVWYFPAPNLSRQSRVRQAGNVWIKLADYGISQVSTGFTLRVGNSPVGTPGFMAPELFDRARQDVSSEKVGRILTCQLFIVFYIVITVHFGHALGIEQ